MIKQYNVKGEEQLCFVVKEGTASDIVIPIKYLQPIDYKRISDMEVQGGELMKVMRDTRLDNNINALVQYQTLFVEYKKPKQEKKEISVSEEKKEEEETAAKEGEQPKKRGRGRPKGSRNKK